MMHQPAGAAEARARTSCHNLAWRNLDEKSGHGKNKRAARSQGAGPAGLPTGSARVRRRSSTSASSASATARPGWCPSRSSCTAISSGRSARRRKRRAAGFNEITAELIQKGLKAASSAMALKATIFKAELTVSDLDRNHFATHSLTLARHPSETDERLMVRLFAFALNAGEGLEFGRGLSSEDEADLVRKDLTGAIARGSTWGCPTSATCAGPRGRARHVNVYPYGGRAAALVEPEWRRARTPRQRERDRDPRIRDAARARPRAALDAPRLHDPGRPAVVFGRRGGYAAFRAGRAQGGRGRRGPALTAHPFGPRPFGPSPAPPHH